MEKIEENRNYALDVIRALAITLVLTIHAFSFKASEGASVLQEGILCLAKNGCSSIFIVNWIFKL